MTWLLSPSGWPTYAVDGSLLGRRLAEDGWTVIDSAAVQPAIDAYNAGQPLPPSEVDYLTEQEAASAIGGTGPLGVAARAAFVTPESAVPMISARTFLGANFAFFGDSQTNYGEGYPFYAALISQGAFRAAHVRSNSGNTSAQLLALIDAQIITATPRPTACVLLCGANDAQGSTPLTTYRANVEEMVSRLRAAGIAPVLATIPPNNTDATDVYVRTYNAWLMRYAETQRIPLVDFYTLLVDQGTGNWKAAYDQGDGLHPTNPGNKVMGQLAYDTLKPLLTPRPYLLQPVAGDPNLQANSNFATDSNADGLADALSASLVAGFAVSRVADPAGFYWQRTTLSGAGTNRRQVLSASVTVSSGKVAIGDRLRFAARVRSGQANAASGSSGTTLQITCYTAGYAGVTLNRILTASAGAMSQQIDGIVSDEFVIPADTEIIQWSHLVGPADGTYDVAQPTLYDLTKLGIA